MFGTNNKQDIRKKKPPFSIVAAIQCNKITNKFRQVSWIILGSYEAGQWNE
jgi:hypothetical protein